MINARIKRLFFDRKAVISAVDRTTRKVLSRIGSFIRRDARKSIRSGGKKHKVSAPGEPPRSHTGDLKNGIVFAYVEDTKSVVIGPIKMVTKGASPFGGATIPQILEEGGTTPGFRGRGRRRKPVRQVTIQARPYMSPALSLNLPKLPAMWANSVTR